MWISLGGGRQCRALQQPQQAVLQQCMRQAAATGEHRQQASLWDGTHSKQCYTEPAQLRQGHSSRDAQTHACINKPDCTQFNWCLLSKTAAEGAQQWCTADEHEA